MGPAGDRGAFFIGTPSTPTTAARVVAGSAGPPRHNRQASADSMARAHRHNRDTVASKVDSSRNNGIGSEHSDPSGSDASLSRNRLLSG